MSKIINVLVVVDTENIDNNNIQKTVVLVDDNLDSDTTAGDSETFTIMASPGDAVVFKIIAVNTVTTVEFQEFAWENQQGSSHCFNPLPMQSNNWTGEVSGNPGDHENFSITFFVDQKGSFTLDPKIQIKQVGGSI